MKGTAQSRGSRSVGSLWGGTAARTRAVGDEGGPGGIIPTVPQMQPRFPLTSSPGDPHP